MILSAVLVGYLLYGKFFISKWAGEGYESAYYVGALIMIPYIIPLIQNILLLELQFCTRSRCNFF